MVHPAKKLHGAAAFMHPVEIMRKTHLERLATNAVSYTHLDVYKRQVRHVRTRAEQAEFLAWLTSRRS